MEGKGKGKGSGAQQKPTSSSKGKKLSANARDRLRRALGLCTEIAADMEGGNKEAFGAALRRACKLLSRAHSGRLSNTRLQVLRGEHGVYAFAAALTKRKSTFRALLAPLAEVVQLCVRFCIDSLRAGSKSRELLYTLHYLLSPTSPVAHQPRGFYQTYVKNNLPSRIPKAEPAWSVAGAAGTANAAVPAFAAFALETMGALDGFQALMDSWLADTEEPVRQHTHFSLSRPFPWSHLVYHIPVVRAGAAVYSVPTHTHPHARYPPHVHPSTSPASR